MKSYKNPLQDRVKNISRFSDIKRDPVLNILQATIQNIFTKMIKKGENENDESQKEYTFVTCMSC